MLMKKYKSNFLTTLFYMTLMILISVGYAFIRNKMEGMFFFIPLMIVISIVFIIVDYYKVNKINQLIKCGIPLQARITNIHTHNIKTRKVLANFETQEYTIEAQAEETGDKKYLSHRFYALPPVNAGESVCIYLDPENKEHYFLDTRTILESMNAPLRLPHFVTFLNHPF